MRDEITSDAVDMLDTVWAVVSGPGPIAEMGVLAEDQGLFTYSELFTLMEAGFTVTFPDRPAED